MMIWSDFIQGQSEWYTWRGMDFLISSEQLEELSIWF